jgi:hypothetical protein
MALTQVASGLIASVSGASLTGTQTIPKATLPTGSVLQVVQTNYTQQLSLLTGSNSGGTSTTEVSQFRCAITLSSASSKVLVQFNVTGVSNASTAAITLLRSTNSGSSFSPIDYGTTVVSGQRQVTVGSMYTFNDSNQARSFSAMFLDSPGVTSGLVYSLGLSNDSSSTVIYINQSITNQSNITGFCATSSVTLMEISA